MAAARISAGARGKRRKYQREGDGSRSMWRCHVKRRRSWSWPTAGPERRRAVLGADGGKQRKELEVEEKDPNAISKNSRDQSVN